MRPEMRLPTMTALIGAVLVVLGVIYLTVECQALPGFMGPVHGDTAPRTGLGLASLVFGLIVLGLAGLSFARDDAKHRNR